MGPTALGKPRVRKATTPTPVPPRVTPPMAATQFTTPSPGVVPHHRIATPVVRDKFESLEDDHPTMALGREDILPGVAQDRTPTLLPHAPAIPNFRARPEAEPDPATMVRRPSSSSVDAEEGSRGAPYAVWIFASILVGMLSYHVAPPVVALLHPRHVTAQASDTSTSP